MANRFREHRLWFVAISCWPSQMVTGVFLSGICCVPSESPVCSHSYLSLRGRGSSQRFPPGDLTQSCSDSTKTQTPAKSLYGYKTLVITSQNSPLSSSGWSSRTKLLPPLETQQTRSEKLISTQRRSDLTEAALWRQKVALDKKDTWKKWLWRIKSGVIWRLHD